VSTCIELALKDAGIDKEQVNYINAHATRFVTDIAGLQELGAEQGACVLYVIK
jgi:3-oxoacyl-[acyl-carrier-protein] synthase II